VYLNQAIAMHRLKPVANDKVFGFNEAVQAAEYLQSPVRRGFPDGDLEITLDY
jgi:hypothetical protein